MGGEYIQYRMINFVVREHGEGEFQEKLPQEGPLISRSSPDSFLTSSIIMFKVTKSEVLVLQEVLEIRWESSHFTDEKRTKC